MIWAGLSKKVSAKESVDILRTLRAVLAQGEVWVRSCFPFVLPCVDVLAAHDLNDVPGKDAAVLGEMTLHVPIEATKLAFIFIALSGRRLFYCDETHFLPIMVMSLCDGNQLLCITTLSTFDNAFALCNGIIIPPIDVKKIDGSLIRLVNETTSAYGDVILPPIDRSLPPAETILPSGLLMTLSSSLVPFCVLLCPSVVVFR